MQPLLSDGTNDPHKFPCWLWSKNARKWFRCYAGVIYANTGGRELYTHWHPDQPTAPESVEEGITTERDVRCHVATPPAPDWAEQAAKEAREIITYSIGRHVAMIQDHRDWLAKDISARVEAIIRQHAPKPAAPSADIADHAKEPLPDAEDYAKHVARHIYPDHSNAARVIQIALNEWLSRNLAHAPKPDAPVDEGKVREALRFGRAEFFRHKESGTGPFAHENDYILAALRPFLAAPSAEDTERLDWLEKEKCALVCLHDDLRGHKWTAEFEKQEWTECETARAAIDAARNAKQEEK